MGSILLNHTISNGASSGERQVSRPGFHAELLVWLGGRASTLGNFRVQVTMDEATKIPEMKTGDIGAWLASVLVEALSESQST